MLSKLPLPDISDKIIIIGHSGSGKTVLMDYIIEHLAFKLTKNRCLYIVDSANQLSKVPNYNYRGETECNRPHANKYCVKLHTPDDLEALITALNHKNKLEFFLTIDEVDRFTGPNTIMPETKLYLEEGRNFNRGGLFSVRRVGLLNKSIFSNAHYLYLFKINNKADRDYLGTILDTNISDLDYHNEHSFFVFDLYNTKNLGEFLIKM